MTSKEIVIFTILAYIVSNFMKDWQFSLFALIFNLLSMLAISGFIFAVREFLK